MIAFAYLSVGAIYAWKRWNHEDTFVFYLAASMLAWPVIWAVSKLPAR